MINNNKEHATLVALNGKEPGNSNGERKLSAKVDTVTRNFSVFDLWSIRKNARSLKIHNRIPRL